MKKINLLYVSMILLVIISFVLGMYQYNSCKLKRIEIDEDIKIEELPETDHIMQKINEKKQEVICALDTEKLPNEDYYNYVSGKGTGKNVNCSILLKQDDEYYEIKTLLEGDTNGPKVNFTGCIKSKYLKENYELMLYDKECQKIYTYTGGASENNS